LDNLPIKDIKTISDVLDFSIYTFLFLFLLCLFGVIILGYYFYKKLKKERYRFNLDNSKDTAYKLISLIRDREDSEKYISKLREYTYKKDVPKMDENLFKEITKKFKIDYQL